jgi:hypothetical protein
VTACSAVFDTERIYVSALAQAPSGYLVGVPPTADPGPHALQLPGPVPVSASASADASPVVGHVYVNDNTKGANTIGAFDRHADGTLTPERRSPFPAGGAGTGSGLASQDAIQFSADGRFVIAVDAGSNQVSVLRVHHDGSLGLVPGGVVSSGGTLPDSIAVHGNLVYVANSGNGGSNYTGFRLGSNGRLSPIPRSTVTLAAGAAPAFAVNDGNLTELATSPFKLPAGAAPAGIIVTAVQRPSVTGPASSRRRDVRLAQHLSGCHRPATGPDPARQRDGITHDRAFPRRPRCVTKIISGARYVREETLPPATAQACPS